MFRLTKSGYRGLRGEHTIEPYGLRRKKPNRPMKWKRWLPLVCVRRRR